MQVDQIYNLACPASPVHYQKNPIETMKTSVLGAINMLELALKTKARILQSSTSEVYGDPLVHPQPETYRGNVNINGMRSCYDEGKRAAETLFMDYHKAYGVDIRIIRIFNTYGPNMHPHDGRVISNFIMQALRNEEITIYGDGNQTRSFQYIDDLIEGMTRMMNNGN
jgi:UDP-glucuronate decarboxylase